VLSYLTFVQVRKIYNETEFVMQAFGNSSVHWMALLTDTPPYAGQVPRLGEARNSIEEIVRYTACEEEGKRKWAKVYGTMKIKCRLQFFFLQFCEHRHTRS